MRAVALLLVLLLGACGDASVEPPPPPAQLATTITPPTTTFPKTTSPSTTTLPPPTTTTTTVAPFEFPAVLVAGPGGVELVAGGEATVLCDHPANAAAPDGSGGAVVALDVATTFSWDEQARRYREDPPKTVELMRMDASGEATRLFADDFDAIDGLVEVAMIADRPTAVVWRTVPGPSFPHSDDVDWQVVSESILSYLVLIDLETGDQAVLGLVASYESDVRIASFGGDGMALVMESYGGGMTPLWWAPMATLERIDPDTLGTAVDPWLEEACDGGACATITDAPPCGDDEGCWVEVRRPRMAPDGSAVAYVEVAYSTTGRQGPVAVVAEVPSGVERWRLPITGADPHANVWPVAVDFDGERVLVSFTGVGPDAPGFAVLLDRTGELGRLPVDGRAVFWDLGG